MKKLCDVGELLMLGCCCRDGHVGKVLCDADRKEVLLRRVLE